MGRVSKADGVADHGINGQTSGGGAVGAVVHAVALGCDVGTATAVRALELDVGYEMVLAFLSSRHCRNSLLITAIITVVHAIAAAIRP